MRIVAVADTHTFQADLGELPAGDVFVHAGDICRRGSLDELAPAAEWMRSLRFAHKVVVAGNHDWCFVHEPERARATLGPEIIYLEDQAATIDGVRFWGSPWQPAFNGWAFNLPRGAPLAEKWALIPEHTDVLITHGPPLGVGDNQHAEVMRAEDSYLHRAGCEALQAAVARLAPALHMFGHIHQDGGLWQRERTTYANVTTWECERRPTVVDYDPATRTVTAVDVPPRE
ncbi:MAG: hypothetical protein Tsb0020_50530 [Haliangiales bacterium]